MQAGESAELARSRRWARLGAILAAACFAVVLLSAAPAWAGTSVANGLLAYDCGTGQICVVNADGSGAKTLSLGITNASRPRWSPDGSRITFESNASGTYQVYMVNADGSGLVQITNTATSSTDPSFTSDSNSILFVNGSAIMETAASALSSPNVVLASGAPSGLPGGPVESTNGATIAFSGNDAGIWTMPSGGGAPTQRASGSQEYNPAWSADGSRIYFRQLVSSQWQVDWVAPGGGATTPVASSNDIDPAPSPDGQKLAYYEIGAGIEISTPDGALPTQVPGLGSGEFELSWQPVTVYTVTTASDVDDAGVCGTTCSLRDAITAANAHPGHEIINFAIPGGGTPHIVVATGTLNALPAISGPVTIDGSSGGAPAVELSPATSGFEGLDVTGGSTTIRGLIIHGFSAQIRLDTGDANTVAGNWVGLDASAASTSDQNGIVLGASSDNTIGGTSAADRNVIDTEFPIAGDAASNNIVEGNYLGVDPTGATQVGSVDPGISFDNGGGGNTIGGTVPGSANVIASSDDAIDLGSNDNTVEGNSIGTNAAETQVIGVDIGVNIESNATGNTVGGTSAAAANVIAGVTDTAFLVTAGGNTFEGNFIGTDRSGSAYATVNDEGVRQLNYTSANANLYANNLFENTQNYGLEFDNSPATVKGNTITGTGDVGVEIKEPSGVQVTQNSIHDDGTPGIFYEGAGGQGPPIPALGTAAIGASTVEVTGTLSTPTNGATYNLEIFRNSAANGCAADAEGETYLGTIAVTGNGGTASFDSTVPIGGSGTAITATATDPTLTTSEFSNCIDASTDSTQPGPVYTVNSNANPGDGTCTVNNCTLAEAINAANSDGVDSTIDFDLTGSTEIDVSSLMPLPGIAQPVQIDGYSQPGASANTASVGDNAVPGVDLVGLDANVFTLLSVNSDADGTIIDGIAFAGPGAEGIDLQPDSGNDQVYGNFFGTLDGTTPYSSSFTNANVVDSGTGNTVGGSTLAARNVIVNGGGYGVYLAAAQGADVEGNLIGVDATGDNALPNFIGVELDSESAGNTIRANTVSGSSSAGIGVGGAASTIIAGNKIGTNDAGDATIPNIEWGIVDQGTGTTIGGLTTADRNLISGNHDDAGINLLSGSGAQVEGNWIGLAANGTAVLGNLGAGIHVHSGHATIQHNVISGNGGDGVFVDGAANATINSNVIGLLPDNTTPAGNAGAGVEVVNATGTLIGGPNGSDGNVISANGNTGEVLLGSSSSDTTGSGATVQNNVIGLTEAKSAEVAGSPDAIEIEDDHGSNTVADNTIGGTTNGIFICKSADNSVVRNVVGSNTAAPGGVDFGVSNQGIAISDGCSGSGDATGNVIGGSVANRNFVFGSQLFDIAVGADSNEVSYNVVDGTKGGAAIQVDGNNNVLHDNSVTGATTGGAGPGNGIEVDSGTGNTIYANTIFGNSSIAIDLGGDGATPNDQNDPDTGANNLQNYPDLTGATLAGGTLTISGSIDSPTSGGAYTVDVYQSPQCQGTDGAHPAAVWVGSFTNNGGSAPFTKVIQTFTHDPNVTVTATDINGNTSEVSPCTPAQSVSASGGSLSDSSQVDPGPTLYPVDLTAEGTEDWAIWGYGNGGASTSLAPDARKAGEAEISDLTNIDPAPSAPLRGLGQFTCPANCSPFAFSWSDGGSDPSENGVFGGLQHDGEAPADVSTLGKGFAFDVPANTTTQTLKVYVATNRASGELFASLSDGSAPDITDTLPAETNLASAVYTVTYAAASANQTLHVEWIENGGQLQHELPVRQRRDLRRRARRPEQHRHRRHRGPDERRDREDVGVERHARQHVAGRVRAVAERGDAGPDQRAPDQRLADQRPADQRAADQWAADQWAADQRAADQWAADQWAADQWAADQRLADQRSADQRARGSRRLVDAAGRDAACRRATAVDHAAAGTEPANPAAHHPRRARSLRQHARPGDDRRACARGDADQRPRLAAVVARRTPRLVQERRADVHDRERRQREPLRTRPRRRADQWPADQRLADQRLAALHPPDQRPADQRSPDQRPEPVRLADQRPADQRLADQRSADQRLADRSARPDRHVRHVRG